MLNSIRCSAIVMMLALLCNIASAQTVQDIDSLDDNAIERLVVGDEYTIIAKRNDVEERFVGELVKANDRWIVLRQVIESRNEFGVPVLSKVPYANRLFKNVGIGREKQFVWIPTEAATIQGRIRATRSPNSLAPQSEEPTLKSNCQIQFVDDGKVVVNTGDLTEITDDQLTITEHRVLTEMQGVPYIMDVPLVGGLFRNTTNRSQDVQLKRAHNDILCVRVSYEHFFEADE